MEQLITISLEELSRIVRAAAFDAAREVVREVKSKNPKYNRNQAAEYMEMSVGAFDKIRHLIPVRIDKSRECWLESDLDAYKASRMIGPRNKKLS